MKNYVYCLNTNTWEQYELTNILAIDNLRGSSKEDNMLLAVAVNASNKIVTYPNEDDVLANKAVLRTKKFSITTKTGAVTPIKIRKIRVVYEASNIEGKCTTAKIRVYNDRFTSQNYKEGTITLKDSGLWTGIPIGYKGTAFEIIIENASSIQDIEILVISTQKIEGNNTEE